MTRRYTYLHCAASVVGLYIFLTDTSSNIQWMYDQIGTLLDSDIAVVLAVAIGGVTFMAVSTRCWQERQYASSLMFALAWLICTVFSFTATADRMASRYHAKHEKLAAVHAEHASKREAVQKARKGVDTWCGQWGSRARTLCNAYKANLREAESAYDPSKLAPPAFALGVTISKITGGAISTSQVDLYQPLLAPIALLFAGLLLAWGVNGQVVEPEFSFEASSKASLEAKLKRFWVGFEAEHGRHPTVAEMTSNTGIEEGTCRYHRKKFAGEDCEPKRRQRAEAKKESSTDIAAHERKLIFPAEFRPNAAS